MDKKLITVLGNVLNDNYSNVDKDVTLITKSLEDFLEFQLLYIKFQNDKFQKLKNFFVQDKNLDIKLNKIFEESLKQSKNEYKVVSSTLPLEMFVVPGGKSDFTMKKIRTIYELMDEDFSVLSLLGNDNYDDKYPLAHKLLNFNAKDLPKDFRESLIDTLFDSQGAMEWSIDGPSRIEAIKSTLPLYTSHKVLDIYKTVITSTAKQNNISNHVENVINSITEMTVHPEKIFKTKEQEYMLDCLATIIKTFQIPVKNENIFNVEDFNYRRPAEEMGIPATPAKTREKIQDNLEQFKSHITQQLVIKKPKPKI